MKHTALTTMKAVLKHVHNKIPAQNCVIEQVVVEKIREIIEVLHENNFSESIHITVDPENDYISMFSRDETTYFIDYSEWDREE